MKSILALEGPNFSGRTKRLREWVGLSNRPDMETACRHNAYIGPDSASALSGMAPTVAAEIELMASDIDAAKAGKKAIEDLGLEYCLDQNPFTLSGGEQVVVAIVTATAGRPERLAIDCALEQLSDGMRYRVLNYLEKTMEGELMVADNRLEEWYDGPKETLQETTNSPHLGTIEGLATNSNEAETEIKLVDLGYSYIKGRPIFENLNLTLEAGTKYLLRGPNGSGKTTLSKILCGLLKPTTGEIYVNGQRVEPWRTPGKFVAYHFQNPDFQMFSTRVIDQFGSKFNIHDRVTRYFGLSELLHEHPLDLSYVYKKRVAIASAFARNNVYVILDEPTIGQDDRFVAALTTPKFQPAYITISHSQCFINLPTIDLVKRNEGDANNILLCQRTSEAVSQQMGNDHIRLTVKWPGKKGGDPLQHENYRPQDENAQQL